MGNRIGQRLTPTHAVVISCIALFLSVSGSAAIALTGENTVDSKDVKPNALRAEDLASNSVTFDELARNSVNPSHILNGSVHSPELTNTITKPSALAHVGSGQNDVVTVPCPSGDKVLSGGYTILGEGPGHVTSDTKSGNGWAIQMVGEGDAGTYFYVYAYCLE